MHRALIFGLPFAIASVLVACSSDNSSSSSSSSGGTGTDASTPTANDSGTPGKDGGGTGSDASSTNDAGSDASSDGGNEAGASAACQAYCTCMTANCQGTAPEGASCLSDCAAQTTWDLQCRTDHCGFAAADPGTHCPHAAGQAICQ